MNYYSVRVNHQEGILDKLLNFVQYDKFTEYIFVEETYSIKSSSDCKRHYHIAIVTSLGKTSVSSRLLKICPELKTTRQEASLYNLKVWGTGDEDLKNFYQYHLKGKSLGDYDVKLTTLKEEMLQKYNKGFWDDLIAYRSKVKDSRIKRTYDELEKFVKMRESSFIVESQYEVKGHYDPLDCSWIPTERGVHKTLRRKVLFELIIEFYNGAVQYPVLELRYNQLLYKYSRVTLVSDLMSRFTQYRDLSEIILSDECIDGEL